MASDILLYNSTHVPVGEDQKQHLELTRDIAQKFNLDFDCPNFFTVPEPLIQKNFSRIMSLRDGKKKMSKSDPSDQSRINLSDDKDQIVNKIKKAKTDSGELPENGDDLIKRPEINNLIGIFSSIQDQDLNSTLNEFKGKKFSEFKEKLAEVLVEKIYPISREINKLLKDEKYIDQILLEGSIKAEKIAKMKVKDIKNQIGF